MSKHKKQHFVPACYLKAWCDPEAPPMHKPYVWVFDRNGQNVRRKAPENIFHESDMYTTFGKNGERDLILEQGLSQLEMEFTRIRNSKINYGRDLTPDEHILLCAFTATAQARTPANREHQRKQWERPLRMMERMTEAVANMTPDTKERFIASQPPRSVNSKGSIGYEEVKQMHENPLQTLLYPMIQATTPLLCKLDMAFLVSNDEIGFITSDHPCVWFDPDSCRRPPMYRGPALMYETIEITVPLSPTHCLLLNRQGMNGYIQVQPNVVHEVNRRTRFEADEYFVVRRNVKLDHWFDRGREPEDSWDRLHPRSGG
ncbi:DUF4238 domain-containing protein [Aromatoleum anaerobium]|uniref:DUF4238 domain-containing protein n=1 Tax=Aromatoleum anaerobium TaxID=182180 RepID=A0ABX1PS06_9RHOO|nr:DUF4238 domain-containing protein [Aromatoleum anaerobium]